MYDVVVSNVCGEVTSDAAQLTVAGGVNITDHPSGRNVCAGEPVEFSVYAGDDPSLIYQWRKDLVEIAGATTDTYSIASAAFSDAGVYDVMVSSDCGAVISDPAVLTVDDCPADCPWDCQAVPDGAVNVADFLALLAQWNGTGSCDFDGGGGGVTDFLAILAHWGPCP
jgi:hypothetical protein